MIHGMTKRQHDTLVFIEKYVAVNGYSPSFDNIKDGLGLRSKSGVHRLIHALRERGLVSMMDERARTITVLQPALDHVRGLGL